MRRPAKSTPLVGKAPLGSLPAEKGAKAPLLAMPKVPARKNGAGHAFVGGWTQRRGKFLHLLLGIREGRRRKLRFVGMVPTPSNGLAMNFLEDQLRSAEIEESPFVDAVAVSDAASRHWTAPELIAEVDFAGWSKARTLSHPSLNWVTQRPAVRHAHWLKPPK